MKLKLFGSEKGYALLTVLIMFTIFSILGLSLMSYTIGSYEFTKVNTTFIESKSEAEMKAQEVKASILSRINEINANLDKGTLDLQGVITRIDAALSTVETELGSSGLLKKTVLKDGTNGIFLQRIDIEVDMEDSNRKLVKTLTISTIADVFRYSAVTPGELNLNGASYLVGDVYAGKEINVHDSAYFTARDRSCYFIWCDVYLSEFWTDTSFPTINGDLTVVDQTYNHILENHVSKRSFEPTKENLNRYLSSGVRLINDKPQIKPIDVQGLIDEKKKSRIKNEGNHFDLLGNSHQNYFDHSLQARNGWRINDSVEIKGDLLVKGDFVLDGNLKVDGSIYIKGDATFSGELSVGKDEFIYVDKGVTINNLDLTGSIFIQKDIYVSGDFNTNGTVYVERGGDIRNLSNNKGTLVVLSEDTLTVANNSLYTDNPKVIDAFFYSNADLDIYGVGSNLKIRGGIYGQNITLNAVKGKSKESYYSGSKNVASNYDPIYVQWPQAPISFEESRLSIEYKDELILNPPEGIPTVDKVTVKEIDTHYYEN